MQIYLVKSGCNAHKMPFVKSKPKCHMCPDCGTWGPAQDSV